MFQKNQRVIAWKQSHLRLLYITPGEDLPLLNVSGLLGEHVFPITQRPSPLRKMYFCTYWFILILAANGGEDSFIWWMAGNLWEFLYLTKKCLLTIEFYYFLISLGREFLIIQGCFPLLQHKYILLMKKWSIGSRNANLVWNHGRKPMSFWEYESQREGQAQLAPEARNQQSHLEASRVVRACMKFCVCVCWSGKTFQVRV